MFEILGALIQFVATFLLFWVVIICVALFIKNKEKRKIPIIAVSGFYAVVSFIGSGSVFYATASIVLGSVFYYLLVIRE